MINKGTRTRLASPQGWFVQTSPRPKRKASPTRSLFPNRYSDSLPQITWRAVYHLLFLPHYPRFPRPLYSFATNTPGLLSPFISPQIRGCKPKKIQFVQTKNKNLLPSTSPPTLPSPLSSFVAHASSTSPPLCYIIT
jgi:hypothetical protein